MDEAESIEEIMRRVRRLEIRARRLAQEVFSGDYHSSFRGQGLDFDEFREYQPGDEIRFIDWNVTARMETPFIRKFREERELSVILAVDISGSTEYGSDYLSKRERAAEIAALLGFSARYNGDKVGASSFCGRASSLPTSGERRTLRAPSSKGDLDGQTSQTGNFNRRSFEVPSQDPQAEGSDLFHFRLCGLGVRTTLGMPCAST
ncbi:DUF58 domain-containing protein [Akkermansiaceae bacterium]|nr:DUF58 domain-containing protein [Akkermansiaceae bacterium]